MPALGARERQFVVARLAAAVGGGQRGGAVGRSPGDLLHIAQAGLAVGQADDHHAVVQERGVERGERRLLAAMLGGGRGEGAADLADQRALRSEEHTSELQSLMRSSYAVF